MPDVSEILIRSAGMPWPEKSLKGISEKMRCRDESTDASIALIKFDKNAGLPEPLLHGSNQFMFRLQGRYEYIKTGVVVVVGSFYCSPEGDVHGPAILDGLQYPQTPDWYTDEQDAR